MSESCHKQTHAMQQKASLLDYSIGPLLQEQRHLDAERLGGLEVDHQLKFRGLLHGHIGRFSAAKNLDHEECTQADRVGIIGSV